jgi:hypothetical protein
MYEYTEHDFNKQWDILQERIPSQSEIDAMSEIIFRKKLYKNFYLYFVLPSFISFLFLFLFVFILFY